MTPDHALPHEIEPAFDLLLSHLPGAEREYRVARAVELVRSGQMDARGLFVLREGSDLAGVVACEALRGAGGIIWPPILARASDSKLEDLLIGRAVSWLQERGSRLAQCLLPPDDVALASPLLRTGFTRITTLSYLRRNIHHQEDFSPARRLRFAPYNPDNTKVFHETLVRTYQHTLDCPEVNGVRTVEEVIEGHQAQGPFDPSLWLLALEDDQPVGVLMLCVARPDEEWEVGYMGLVPASRRRGLGREILRQALSQAQASRVSSMTLCVDDRNGPAWRLYRLMGFTRFDQRLVFLVVWRRAS
jgi:ribosomal protein S18 acetylase RimI-like enzyme